MYQYGLHSACPAGCTCPSVTMYVVLPTPVPEVKLEHITQYVKAAFSYNTLICKMYLTILIILIGVLI